MRGWLHALAAMIALAAMTVPAACVPAMPPENATPVGRFEWARDRFEQGKYRAAIRSLRDFLVREPLHPKADSARLLLGESLLKSGQELVAANEFSQLAISRPNSAVADDAQFGACRAYWLASPKIQLDQDFTDKAMEECTRLLEFFPRSTLTGPARELLARARDKMARKQYKVGLWYFKRRLYESATIYFESILRNYGETSVVPEVLASLYDSYRLVGFDTEAKAVRERLLKDYPDTRQAHELGALDASPPSG